MKFLFDFFPVLIFFVLYKSKDIYWATGALMIASVLQIAGLYATKKKPETTHWITIGLALPLGALTLILHNPVFVKWKPTLANGLFALVFLGSMFIGKRTMIERMMGHAFRMPSEIWRRLNLAWAVFFVFSGALNLVVAYHCSESTWVNFKFFGVTGLTFAFFLGQMLVLKNYLAPEFAAKTEDPTSGTDPEPG